MRKEHILLLSVIILGVIIVVILANNLSREKIRSPFSSFAPYPTISANNNSVQTISMAPSSSRNIEVLSPRTGDSIKSGLVVKGNARTFESNVVMRLIDNEGNVIIETSTIANSSDAGQFGPFEKMINFQTDSQNGSLEVFQYSAKDGSQIDKVTIPLIFN